MLFQSILTKIGNSERFHCYMTSSLIKLSLCEGWPLGSYDSILDPIITQIHRTEVTNPNQYFYQYDSQTFSKSLHSGHAEILSVFPVPIWNFELNIL